MYPQDAWQLRQDFLVNALEFPGILHFDAQKIIGAAGHQEAFPDLRVPAHRGLEPVQMVFGLPFECNVDENRNRRARVRGVDQRGISADDACGLHQLDPSQTGRRRKPHFRRELHIAHARIQPQKTKDIAVDCIKSLH